MADTPPCLGRPGGAVPSGRFTNQQSYACVLSLLVICLAVYLLVPAPQPCQGYRDGDACGQPARPALSVHAGQELVSYYCELCWEYLLVDLQEISCKDGIRTYRLDLVYASPVIILRKDS